MLQKGSMKLSAEQLIQIAITILHILQWLRGTILLYKKIFHARFFGVIKNALKVDCSRTNFCGVLCILVKILYMPQRKTPGVHFEQRYRILFCLGGPGQI